MTQVTSPANTREGYECCQAEGLGELRGFTLALK